MLITYQLKQQLSGNNYYLIYCLELPDVKYTDTVEFLTWLAIWNFSQHKMENKTSQRILVRCVYQQSINKIVLCISFPYVRSFQDIYEYYMKLVSNFF